MAHLRSNKPQLLARVRRLTGQLTALEKAINADADCTTVLHQAAAIRGAVSGLVGQLFEEHAREHVAHPDLDAGERAQGLEDLLVLIRRYAK